MSNETQYQNWINNQLDPDYTLPGGNGSTPPVNVFNIKGSLGLQKYKAIEPDHVDYYERNRKYIEQSLWEQEEAEDNYLRNHGAG